MTGRSQPSEDGCTGRTFQAEGAVGPEGTRRPAPRTPRETARLPAWGLGVPAGGSCPMQRARGGLGSGGQETGRPGLWVLAGKPGQRSPSGSDSVSLALCALIIFIFRACCDARMR